MNRKQGGPQKPSQFSKKRRKKRRINILLFLAEI
jgi:hypothetical protein